jgi:F0F1-type ATP synthase membrane subunit c/vacuolar-type H+-ATPase subunit K
MNENPGAEARYKTLVVIWAALTMSQLMFVALVYFTRPGLFRFDLARPALGGGPGGTGSTALIIGFAAASATAVALSFAFKRRLNERAVAERNPAHVQTGLIIALALCEASSLFGLALAFAFDYQYYFLWIALGTIGMIFHFPKRDDLHTASQNRER